MFEHHNQTPLILIFIECWFPFGFAASYEFVCGDNTTFGFENSIRSNNNNTNLLYFSMNRECAFHLNYFFAILEFLLFDLKAKLIEESFK